MRYRILGPAIIVVSAIALGALFATAASSSPGAIVVTRFDDPAPDGCATNGCSLREAVAQANSAGSEQTIDIGTTENELFDTPVSITGDVVITNSGGGSVTSNGYRIFDISGGAVVRIENTTISGSSSLVGGCGGAVHNAGDLTLRNSGITDSSVTGNGGALCNEGTATLDDVEIARSMAFNGPGGGVYNTGTMTVIDSLFRDNSVRGSQGGGDGGAIANAENATLNITYSTVSSNSASSTACDDCSSGAGISNEGTLVLEYSTVSDNIADGAAGMENSGNATVRRSTFSANQGGAISNASSSQLLVSNSTISGNFGLEYPDSGVGGITNYGSASLLNDTIVNNTGLQFATGGVFNNTTGATDYKGTIFANNGTKNCNTAGTHISNGFNIFDNETCAHVASDQTSTDPDLGPLADNGGATKTHMPNDGSPAIDNGSPGCPSPDQRDAPRTGGCDVGSVEYGSQPITLTPTPSPTPPPLTFPMGDATCDDQVTNADILQELEFVSGVEEPDRCDRETLPCVSVGDACYAAWMDTNCDGTVDALDVLVIAAHQAGVDVAVEECSAVGEYLPVS